LKAEREREEKKLAKSLIPMALATANSIDREKGMRTAAAELQRLHLSMALRAVALGGSLCRMYQETRLVAGLL
jgi:hypothetical protein